MWMSVERERKERDGRPARVAASLLVSLTLHSIGAILLGLYLLAQEVPEVRDFAADVVVSLIPWTPPEIRPRARTQTPPSEEPASSEEPARQRTESPPAGPAKPTVQASPQFAGSDASSGTPRVYRARALAPLPTEVLDDLARPEPAIRDRSGPETPPIGASAHTGMTGLDPVAYTVSGEIVPVELPEGDLGRDSPEVRRGRLFFAVRRGLGAGNAPGGGGYGYGDGSNGSPIEGTSSGVYRNLMTRLARGILKTTGAKELDVVFIVDTTASMVDNVRGVVAYADDFVNVLIYEGRKLRFGLVTFSDARRSAPKVRGLTSKSGDFRNWLHRAEFTGGGDLAESGLDAVMAAVERLRFRRNARPYFIFISDGPIHDRDYDGQSRYTLDEVLAVLNAKGVILDSVGLDYLPVKQLAWGTGGRWLPIPGKGYLEQTVLPLPVKGNAALGMLATNNGTPTDTIHVYADPYRPTEWFELRWRVLDPRGQKVKGEFTARLTLKEGQTRATFHPTFNPLWFRGRPGYYTVIYRITDDRGGSSVLRRVINAH